MELNVLLIRKYLRSSAIAVNGVLCWLFRIFVLDCKFAIAVKGIFVLIARESVCAGHLLYITHLLYNPEKLRRMSSDGESAVTVNRAEGTPGPRGDQDTLAGLSVSSDSQLSDSPDGVESPIPRGPLRFFANLDYFPTYVHESIYAEINSRTNLAQDKCHRKLARHSPAFRRPVSGRCFF